MRREDWSTDALRKNLVGKWAEFTGWMMFDFEHVKQAENTNPGNPSNFRATCWEVHPVTEIKPLDGPPAELASFQPASLTALQRQHAKHIENAPNGKKSVTKLHNAQLAKFSTKEKQDAQEEAAARFKEP